MRFEELVVFLLEGYIITGCKLMNDKMDEEYFKYGKSVQQTLARE